MNDFKTILTRLKEILSSKDQSIKKIRDKDIAAALNIKASTLASYKSRGKAPYKVILTYCHDNCLNMRKVMFNESEPIVNYPALEPVEDGKVRVKYFRTLAAYARYLSCEIL